MSNNTHALIIGVNDYTTYNPSGRSDLKGARNDAILWWQLCVTHLSMEPENVTVLAAPPLEPAELAAGGAPAYDLSEDELLAMAECSTRGGADLDSITNALGELGKPLLSGKAAGLLTWSGHGTVATWLPARDVGANLALCPSDVQGGGQGELDRTLALAEIAEFLVPDATTSPDAKQRAAVRKARRTAMRNLTLVLDACYTSGDRSVGRLGGRAMHGRDGDPTGGYVEVGDRLLLACREWEQAYEVRVAGRWHGAFSMMLTALVERWSTVAERGGVRVNASYVDLIYRTRLLTDTLGLSAQTPHLEGLPQLGDLAVLQVGTDVRPNITSKSPDAPVLGEQLEPDQLGVSCWELSTMVGGTETTFGWVTSANTPLYSPESNNIQDGVDIYWPSAETWAFDYTALKNLLDGGDPGTMKLRLRKTNSSAGWTADSTVTNWLDKGPLAASEEGGIPLAFASVDADWSSDSSTSWTPSPSTDKALLWSYQPEGATGACLGIQATVGSDSLTGIQVVWWTTNNAQASPFASTGTQTYEFASVTGDRGTFTLPTDDGDDLSWYVDQDPLSSPSTSPDWVPSWEPFPQLKYWGSETSSQTATVSVSMTTDDAPTVSATPTIVYTEGDDKEVITLSGIAKDSELPESFQVTFDPTMGTVGQTYQAVITIETTDVEDNPEPPVCIVYGGEVGSTE